MTAMPPKAGKAASADNGKTSGNPIHPQTGTKTVRRADYPRPSRRSAGLLDAARGGVVPDLAFGAADGGAPVVVATLGLAAMANGRARWRKSLISVSLRQYLQYKPRTAKSPSHGPVTGVSRCGEDAREDRVDMAEVVAKVEFLVELSALSAAVTSASASRSAAKSAPFSHTFIALRCTMRIGILAAGRPGSAPAAPAANGQGRQCGRGSSASVSG